MTTPWQPGYQGVTVVPPGYTDPHSWSPASALQLVATTGPNVAGFALQNGTPNIVSWTAPNDGQLHRALIVYNKHVTSAETGGATGVTWTTPDGTGSPSASLSAGGQAAGSYEAFQGAMVAPGSAVTVKQTSALTAGASAAWADIWAA